MKNMVIYPLKMVILPVRYANVYQRVYQIMVIYPATKWW